MKRLKRHRTRATERKRAAPAALHPVAAKAACTSFPTSRAPPDRKREAPARRAGEACAAARARASLCCAG
eukprot:5830882-Alexandrium_andersonii.AAC.1